VERPIAAALLVAVLFALIAPIVRVFRRRAR
jgi:TctA family transporter